MSLDSSSSSDSDTDSLTGFIVPDSPTLSATNPSSTPLWSSSAERRRGIDAQRTLLRDLKSILSRAESDRQVRLDLYDDVFRFCLQMGKRQRPSSKGSVFMYLKLAHDEVVKRAWAQQGVHLASAEAWDVMLDEVTKVVAGAKEPVYVGGSGGGGTGGAGSTASSGGAHSSPRTSSGATRRGSTAGEVSAGGSPQKRPKFKPHVPTVPRSRKASVTQGQRAAAAAAAGVTSDDPLAEYLEDGGEPEPTRMINVASANDPVYVPSFLEDVLQEHQIEGLTFLWKRVVQERGGAILAHAMGLGKSIQIVTFIYLILRGIRHHNLDCPPLLQRCILILCPKTVYPNWVNEINKWVPASYRKWVGMHVLILDEEPQDRREAMAERWNKYGGVLVSSYDCLKYTVKPKSSGTGAAAGEGSSEAREARMSALLLNKASLLVMDEVQFCFSITLVGGIGDGYYTCVNVTGAYRQE
ncbi:P-loop containing nucleoside triphosphate hydrolase protein [Catenaria anguillulae PL171]|uniref:p-loop containing nucleoside triphosphate hydrolase protein n=1 Tax=Catenaria anguillulae PL171 TaxID=765915 RepID=A0A1Y2I2P9_9FUNG|nr:P-loop containing nucleoside triphosphate hydrolase protein [Catenaria anguillulae PL171]